MRRFFLGFDLSRLSDLSDPLEGACMDHGYDMLHFKQEGWPWYYEGTFKEDSDEVIEWTVFWTPLWTKKLSYVWQFLRQSGYYEPQYHPYN